MLIFILTLFACITNESVSTDTSVCVPDPITSCPTE